LLAINLFINAMKKSEFSFKAKFPIAVFLLIFAACCKNNNPGPSPVITSFYYTSGIIGSPVTIIGDHFIPAVPPEKGNGPFPNTSIVTFNGTVAEAEYIYQDSIGIQHINTRVPAGATSGKITITANGITVSSLDDFIVTVPIYLPNVEVTTVHAGLGVEDVAVDGEGSLYVTPNDSHEIVKITPDGNLHILWSSSTGETPWGIAVDAKGNIFATIFVSYILKIDAGGKVSTLAGSAESGDVDGQGAVARFNWPFGIALDKDGNLYVADTFNHKIRKITPDGTVSTLAGSTQGFKDGIGTNAQFGSPLDVATDGKGNVYVTDGNHIRKVTSDGQVSTVAGSSTPGYLDGTTANARFNELTGIVIDAAGNLFVCDQENYVVRRIAPDGTVVTVAGSTPGDLDGPGSSAKFAHMSGITMDAGGAIYVAQNDDGPIRKIVIH
jgi:sugar lactone lactonase YvrE